MVLSFSSKSILSIFLSEQQRDGPLGPQRSGYEILGEYRVLHAAGLYWSHNHATFMAQDLHLLLNVVKKDFQLCFPLSYAQTPSQQWSVRWKKTKKTQTALSLSLLATPRGCLQAENIQKIRPQVEWQVSAIPHQQHNAVPGNNFTSCQTVCRANWTQKSE